MPLVFCNATEEFCLLVAFLDRRDTQRSHPTRDEAMDHFNAIIKDGKLVKTRRGLQVSRQTFNGLSFVNSSPHDDASGPGPSGATAAPSPTQHEFRFVEEGSESGRETPGPRGKDAEQQDPSSIAQGTQRRRRAARGRRGKSPAASKAGTPTQPSPMSSGYQILHFEHLDEDHDTLPIDPRLDIKTSAGDAPNPDFSLPVDDRALLERHFNSMARSMYPYEDMLTYNPARGTDFHSMITRDMAAMHCVLMCGSITEAITSQTEPTDVAYHISKICAILNQKLSQDHAADPVTLHCIATLAWVGVCCLPLNDTRAEHKLTSTSITRAGLTTGISIYAD
jgi:hypothetical protein